MSVKPIVRLSVAVFVAGASFAASAAGAPATPQSGGSLTYAIARFPPCLDRVQSNPEPSVFQQLTDNLLDQDPDTGKIVPWLADRWTVSPDAKTYTFHLRSGVTFSNGEPLNAKVVADNFNLTWKLAQQGSASAAQAFLKHFVSAEARDASTVVIRFSEANAGFEQAVTEKALAILAPATLAAPLEQRCAKGVIGSGPFVIEQVKTNEQVVLKKRADYRWGSAAFHHQGAAYLDQLTFRVIPEPSVRVGGLLNGEVDAFFDARPDDLPRLNAAGAHLIAGTSAGIAWTLMVNTSKPGLSELAVRQALEHAINRQELVDGLFGGKVKAATGVLSSNHPNYTNEAALLKYDPALAAKLLDDAGWKVAGRDGIRAKNGQKLVLELTFSGASEQPKFELIQQQLRQVGIGTKLQLQSVAEQVQARQSGQWALDSRTWGRADADALYYSYSTQVAPAKGVAPRPEFEAQLEKLGTTIDKEQRRALAAAVQKQILEQGYGLPLHEVTLFVATSQKVHGLRLSNDPYRPIFFDTWLAPRS
ncbi:ABC transporter substrate-binding protein [Burkholderia multivorans]|uniref:ABC transporter substrate-binding protein n=1 Tax=Burkholderia multivorans TaxID=87883 RepID=UPI0037352452